MAFVLPLRIHDDVKGGRTVKGSPWQGEFRHLVVGPPSVKIDLG